MPQTLSPIDQFLADWNQTIAPLTLSQKCHLLGLLAIWINWNQDNPDDPYSLSDADSDYPFINPGMQPAIALLEGKPAKAIGEWILELAAAIEDELPA